MGKTDNKQRMTMELHCWKDEHERDNENLEDAKSQSAIRRFELRHSYHETAYLYRLIKF